MVKQAIKGAKSVLSIEGIAAAAVIFLAFAAVAAATGITTTSVAADLRSRFGGSTPAGA